MCRPVRRFRDSVVAGLATPRLCQRSCPCSFQMHSPRLTPDNNGSRPEGSSRTSGRPTRSSSMTMAPGVSAGHLFGRGHACGQAACDSQGTVCASRSPYQAWPLGVRVPCPACRGHEDTGLVGYISLSRCARLASMAPINRHEPDHYTRPTRRFIVEMNRRVVPPTCISHGLFVGRASCPCFPHRTDKMPGVHRPSRPEPSVRRSLQLLEEVWGVPDIRSR